MKIQQSRSKSDCQRHDERGAALLTAVLITTMLLGIAGMVILSTGMSATTSVDSTAELQAYYGAESGLEAVLNVLRGNVAPRSGLPTGTRIGFRNAVQLDKSNLPSDTAAFAKLSGWLPYDNANNLVTPAGTGYAYRVALSDPDDPAGTQLAADSTYKPKRIKVQAFGFGPRGSMKPSAVSRCSALCIVTELTLNSASRSSWSSLGNAAISAALSSLKTI